MQNKPDTMPQTIETLRHIEHALDLVREQLAAGQYADITLRQDEITLEVLQSNFQKRYANALELSRRAAFGDYSSFAVSDA